MKWKIRKVRIYVYAPFEKPMDEDNYLLDILLYAGEHGEFQADEMAITMKELGIDHLAIRPLSRSTGHFFMTSGVKRSFENFFPLK